MACDVCVITRLLPRHWIDFGYALHGCAQPPSHLYVDWRARGRPAGHIFWLRLQPGPRAPCPGLAVACGRVTWGAFRLRARARTAARAARLLRYASRRRRAAPADNGDPPPRRDASYQAARDIISGTVSCHGVGSCGDRFSRTRFASHLEHFQSKNLKRLKKWYYMQLFCCIHTVATIIALRILLFWPVNHCAFFFFSRQKHHCAFLVATSLRWSGSDVQDVDEKPGAQSCFPRPHDMQFHGVPSVHTTSP
jgi:hypothetical protein